MVTESTNDYLEVVVDYLTDTVYCNSLSHMSEIETCSIRYGFGETLTSCQTSQNNYNSSTSLSSQNVTLSISELHQKLLQNQDFCFLVTATFNKSLTVVVKGNINLKTTATQSTGPLSTVSNRNIKQDDSQGITVIVTTPSLTIIVLILIVLVIVVITVIVKRRSSKAPPERSSNIYE